MFQKVSLKKALWCLCKKISLSNKVVISCTWYKGLELVSIWMRLHGSLSILGHKSRYTVWNLIKSQGNLVYLTKKTTHENWIMGDFEFSNGLPPQTLQLLYKNLSLLLSHRKLFSFSSSF